MERLPGGQRVLVAACVMCTVLMMPAAKGQSRGGVTPLTVSENHRYLVDQNHVPYLLQGEAAWSLIVVPSDEEVEQIIDEYRMKKYG